MTMDPGDVHLGDHEALAAPSVSSAGHALVLEDTAATVASVTRFLAG